MSLKQFPAHLREFGCYSMFFSMWQLCSAMRPTPVLTKWTTMQTFPEKHTNCSEAPNDGRGIVLSHYGQPSIHLGDSCSKSFVFPSWSLILRRKQTEVASFVVIF